MEPFAITHQGLKREENQDRFFIREFYNRTLLMAVTDGMGGETAGGLAAQIAINAFKDFDPDSTAVEAPLIKLFQALAQKVGEEVRKDPKLERMGTTLTTAYIIISIE